MAGDTQTIHGLKACLAVYDHRPHDILRIFYRPHVAPQLGAMLRWAAGRRIVYRELDEEAMRRVAKSAHHEGLALVTQPLRYQTLDLADAPLSARWVALDGVENPHNLGAILRSAAFFGVEGLLAGGVAPEARVNSAALRVAEGGAEYVRLCAAAELAPALEALGEKGWRVIGLETDAPPLPTGGSTAPPWVLVVGHEQQGLSPPVRRVCGAVHAIPAGGGLGSLNVSVAAGVALSWLAGPHRDKPPARGQRRGPATGTKKKRRRKPGA